MWYSIYKIGDVDIDMQHSNIDYMLSSLPQNDQELRPALCSLIDALADHFDQEEQIADERHYNMDDAHRKQHQVLKMQLNKTKKELIKPGTDISAIPSMLQEILNLHIIEYDRHLT